MKTLYLHIGSHKTGTTSLQHSLVQHQDLLKKKDMVLCSQNPDGTNNERGIVHQWINLENFIQYQKSATIDSPSKFASVLASHKESTVIASSENFSFIGQDSVVEELSEELSKHFDQIKIVIYIRRQDKHAVSHHQEGAKKQWKAEIGYFKGVKALPKIENSNFDYLNYEKKIELWAKYFGEDNLIIRVFEKDQLLNGDTVSDFASLLGIEGVIETKTSNLSIGFQRTKVGLLINQILPKSFLVGRIRNLTENSGKLLPSRQAAIDFYAEYVESNKRLNTKYKISKENPAIFNDDFTDYPETPGDEWEEKSANSAITQIFRAIAPYSALNSTDLQKLIAISQRTFPQLSQKLKLILKQDERALANETNRLEANFLRDLATSYEKENITLAYELMLQAKKKRPKGKFILKELEKYKKRITEQKKTSSNHMIKRGKRITRSELSSEKGSFDVAVVGVWYGWNYGSVLTNYALYKLLSESLKLSVIMVEKPRQRVGSKSIEMNPEFHSRKFALKHYKDHISRPRMPREMEELNNRADTFIVGSDQLWHYNLISHSKKSFLLNYVDDSKKKIAFSTSFGHATDSTPQEERGEVGRLLRRFDHIAVREDSGVDILKTYNVEDGVRVLDPIFLPAVSVYDELIKDASVKENEPFMVAYILDPNKEKKKALLHMSNKLGLKLICIIDGNPLRTEKNMDNLGLPVEENMSAENWLYYFRNAQYVVTDSYHGTCFSIYFSKNFAVFGNQKRGLARLNTILGSVDLNDRMVLSPNEVIDNKTILKEIDYDVVNRKLDKEKEDSLNWLKNALHSPKHVKTG